MMEKPETQSSSYDDFISRMNRADTLQDRQLKAVNDSLAQRAKELEFLPPEKWPRLNICWDTAKRSFRFAVDGLTQKEFECSYADGFIVRSVKLSELNAVLHHFNRRDVGETWEIGSPSKLAKVLARAEDGQPLTPILVAPNSHNNHEVVLHGGNHRYAMLNAMRVDTLPVFIEPKNLELVETRLKLYQYELD